ncbi:hypothetical protein SRS16P2_00475 (plasmid) [Variovorax sp. SRS16]|nr:hypothetical protein SRS16P2_00475 [Variovorax sp. SRS16]
MVSAVPYIERLDRILGELVTVASVVSEPEDAKTVFHEVSMPFGGSRPMDRLFFDA